MYPLDDTRIHPKQRFVNPFFRVLSHCTDYVPIFVHARQTVGYKKIFLRRLLQKNVRSPKQMENAHFLQKADGKKFLVSYCLSGMHKKLYAIHAMRQNSKKGIDNSLLWVYSRAVKWIHYHRLDIKTKKTPPRSPEF